MNIDTSTWHYRVYAWWSRKQWIRPGQENLCHYVSGVMVRAPGLWLRNHLPGGGLLGYILWAATVFIPLAYFAYTHWQLAVLMVGLVVGLSIAFFIVEAILNSGNVAVSYVIARKRRVCPFITFDEA